MTPLKPMVWCNARGARGARSQRGFALLIVLWTLVLIALIAGHVAASGRLEIGIAGNLAGNAAAEAARDGAVEAAIFNLTSPNAAVRWQPDGQTHTVQIGDSRVQVTVADEAGRINPNLAPPDLLEALFVVSGVDSARAHRLALAIGQWIGAGKSDEAADQAVRDYHAAGLDYTPPLEPLQTLDELGRVVGITPAFAAALRPHLTLYGPAQPNPAAADPIVRAALDYLAKRNPAAAATAPPAKPQVVRITAAADGPGKARAAASAIVRLGDAPGAHTVLVAWRDETG